MTTTEPEWLIEWRKRKAAINPDAVVMSLPGFGIEEVQTGYFPLLHETTVYVCIDGSGFERRTIGRKFARNGARAVTYASALSEAVEHQHASIHDPHALAGAAWSIVRANVSRLLEAEVPVFLDTDLPDDIARARFVEFCFLSGARGVCALTFPSENRTAADIFDIIERGGFTGAYAFR